jgi:hypothetical protein
VDGAPLLLVFQPRDVPDARRVTDLWRELALRAGLPGLHLVAVAQQDAAWDPSPLGFDAVAVSNQTRIAGPPSAHYGEAIKKRANAVRARLLRRPRVYRYEDALRHFLVPEPPGVTRYPCVIPGWDNTPRSGIRGLVLAGATPVLFAGHVREAVQQVATHDTERRIVLIKSWNEWAEGNYLEPDRRWGRAFLEAMRDAVVAEEADPTLLTVR